MKVVEARLSTGEIVMITEEWFTDWIADGRTWQKLQNLNASFDDGVVAQINPKFIVWARVIER